MTDGILKFCFRKPLLGKRQLVALFRFFDLLSALCDDVQDRQKVLKLEDEANVGLSLVERDLPISVQVTVKKMLH